MKRIFALLFALVVLTTFAGCKDDKADRFTIAWEYITSSLPEGFPKLCEKITTTSENYTADKTETEIAWSRVSKSDFDGYKEKIEEWAGAKFGEQDENNVARLSATVNGKSIEVQAIYNPDASGDHIQSAVYQCQGRIIVTQIEKATE